MYLKSIELTGFKSFGKKSEIVFTSPIASIVGPNGSGKSNIAEAFRFVLGEQSMKSMRSKRGEDLIWGGSPALPRSNRASVKVLFDNTKRLLDLDFKEVTVERVVYRDGQNEYLLNGTQVRLKDVIRLLAGANIGGSGYQIISQGEADRILNASPKERREMVEDALGLKLYQHKKAESERKLDETAVNIDKTKSLRRELAPHLTFLRVQVEKIEKARELKDELAHRLNDYLARENAWITQEDARLLQEARVYDAELRETQEQLRAVRAERGEVDGTHAAALQGKLHEVGNTLNDLRRRRDELTRDLGRAEGALEVVGGHADEHISVAAAKACLREMHDLLASLENEYSLDTFRRVVKEARTRAHDLLHGPAREEPGINTELHERIAGLYASLQALEAEEGAARERQEQLRAEGAQLREQAHEAEREGLALESKVRDIHSKLATVQSARDRIAEARRRFEDEVREGIALIGAAVHSWQKDHVPEGALAEDRSAQEKRRRDVERLKIKLEESGIGNADDVVREFRHTKERDEFLAKEMHDLETSAASLRDIIADLEKTIDARFTEGLHHINVALKNFFTKLFNGGDAELRIETPRRDMSRSSASTEDDEGLEEGSDDEALYAGLTISVSLPRKKVRGLEVLSGGERALTSIALIFSMSQVNPPPFLILDETDAALDEANSRRYADMIRELGHKSQLIVITHNRATMAAAGELYGITMASDGVSKLLSVKLEEAERVAK
jgi:chromosome segregation protein